MERQWQWPWERSTTTAVIITKTTEKEPSTEEWQREEGEQTMNVHSVYV